jgi:hypothetical protein
MSYKLAALLALPILLVQGRQVRKRTLRILVIGDSAEAGVGAGHQDDALLGHGQWYTANAQISVITTTAKMDNGKPD